VFSPVYWALVRLFAHKPPKTVHQLDLFRITAGVFDGGLRLAFDFFNRASHPSVGLLGAISLVCTFSTTLISPGRLATGRWLLGDQVLLYHTMSELVGGA
jgi:hypothetical protein